MIILQSKQKAGALVFVLSALLILSFLLIVGLRSSEQLKQIVSFRSEADRLKQTASAHLNILKHEILQVVQQEVDLGINGNYQNIDLQSKVSPKLESEGESSFQIQCYESDNQTPCINSEDFPKIVKISVQVEGKKGSRTKLISESRIDPERLLNYAYLVTQESKTNLTIGAGNFSGKVGVTFKRPDKSKIRLAPPLGEELIFNEVFATNLDISSEKIQFGFENQNRPFGFVDLKKGVASNKTVPDLQTGFDNLKPEAIRSSEPDGHIAHSARIQLGGGSSNPCEARITEVVYRPGNCTGGSPRTNVCGSGSYEEVVIHEGGPLADDSVYLVRAKEIQIESLDPTQTEAINCATGTSILMEGGDAYFRQSITRADPDGSQASEDAVATLAFVNTTHSNIIDSGFKSLNNQTYEDIIMNGEVIDPDMVSAKIEASLIATSEGQKALQIADELMSSHSTGLGTLSTFGLIATPELGFTKSRVTDDNGSEIFGFDKVLMKYNPGIQSAPPRGTETSIKGLNLMMTTDRVYFEETQIAEAISYLNH